MPWTERKLLSAELAQDERVSYALQALQALGVTSASEAWDNWEISVYKPGSKGGHQSVHLYPWSSETMSERPDQAYFMVDFYSDGRRAVWLKRGLEPNVSAHVTLVSDYGSDDNLPTRWREVTMTGGIYLRLGPKNEVVTVEGYEDHQHFVAREETDGPQAVNEAMLRVGRILGLPGDQVPTAQTFNDGLLVNAILDPDQPFDSGQLFALSREKA